MRREEIRPLSADQERALLSSVERADDRLRTLYTSLFIPGCVPASYWRSAGLTETVRLYDLRHTRATLLLSRNVHPKYVQELLGHASIALTLDTYSHILPGMDGGIGGALEEALG